MARNNRELSQLAAFIGIEDHSQEIELGSNYEYAQVVAIGASLYAGTDEAPAVGIGTTDIVRAFQVASRDGSLFSKVQNAEGVPQGGGVELEGDLVVGGISTIGGTVTINEGINDIEYQDSLALSIPLRVVELGGNIGINTLLQGSVGIGTTLIALDINSTTISIGNSAGGKITSKLPLFVDGVDTFNLGAASTIGEVQPILEVQGGKTSVQGPIVIGPGLAGTSISQTTDTETGLITINGDIGLRGSVYQDFGNFKTPEISILSGGSIFMEADTTVLQCKSFSDFSEGYTELGAISQSSPFIATFNSSIYISNGSNPLGFSTIGEQNAGALQVAGGAIFGQDVFIVGQLQTTGIISCTDLEVSTGIGGRTQIFSPTIDIGQSGVLGVSTHKINLNNQINSAIIPFEPNFYNLGDASYTWKTLFVETINVDNVAINTEAVVNNLRITGVSTNQGEFYHTGLEGTAIFYNGLEIQNNSILDNTFIQTLTAADDILGTATTSLRAQAIDVGVAVTDQYYSVLLTDSTGNNTKRSVFVDQPDAASGGLRLNPFDHSFLVDANLYVGGPITSDTIYIGMNPEAITNKTLEFYNDGPNIIKMFTNDQRSLSIGSTLGITTFNTYETCLRGSLKLGTPGIDTAAIRSANGLENITITGSDLTEFSGNIAMEGSDIDVRNGILRLANNFTTTVDAFQLANQITIGSTAGFTSFRNPLVRFEGEVRIDSNTILASDGQPNIVMTGADLTRFAGDIQVDGSDILVAGGVTNITMVNGNNTIFAGDIQVNGNELRDSNGELSISFIGDGLVSIASTLRVEGNSIQSGAGVTNITLATGYTQIEADLRVNGDRIRASDNSINITMDAATNTTVAGDLTVGSNKINAADGVECVELINGTGAVGIASHLTANGDLYVRGSTTNILSDSINLRDKLIDIGLGISTVTNFELVVPTLDENKDVGLLLNYYDTTPKKAAIFWDDSLGSIGIASDVSETSEVLSINSYAKIVTKSVTISDCAGTSDIIECEGTTRTLANITIDGGEY